MYILYIIELSNKRKGKMKKITKATFKSFIRKNADKLFVNNLSSFDGRVDGVRECKEGFEKPDRNEWAVNHSNNTLGIRQIWLAGMGHDWFSSYEDDNHIGIKYSNSCGSGVVAIAK